MLWKKIKSFGYSCFTLFIAFSNVALVLETCTTSPLGLGAIFNYGTDHIHLHATDATDCKFELDSEVCSGGSFI